MYNFGREGIPGKVLKMQGRDKGGSGPDLFFQRTGVAFRQEAPKTKQ